jgi:hypothetical protein
LRLLDFLRRADDDGAGGPCSKWFNGLLFEDLVLPVDGNRVSGRGDQTSLR